MCYITCRTKEEEQKDRKRFPGKEVPRPCSGRKNNRIQRKAHLSGTGKTGTGRDRKGEMIYVDAQHFQR